MKEEALFHFENKFDIESYNRLQNFYMSVIQKSNIIALIIFYILSIIAFLYGIIFLNTDISSYLIVETIFTAFIVIAIMYPKIKHITHEKFVNSKFYKKNRKLEFIFYSNYLVVKEGNLERKYKYINIFRTYITDKDFFFRIDKNIAFILPKDNVSDIEKFEEFLTRKFQSRFIKKYNKNLK